MAASTTYHVIGDLWVTLCSEDWVNYVNEEVYDLFTACRLLLDFYESETERYLGDDFDSFMNTMAMPIHSAQRPEWQTAYEEICLFDKKEQAALPSEVFVNAARNWLGLVNGLEPDGCGDHAPVFRMSIVDQNTGDEFLLFDDHFEYKVSK
eukprot:TRINITY_DN40047_c0_g1_i1.p1 TRINITY_DN40047_c0_g1~~TRINITY_DN40047_c0_g1_i1.p1  ORF type:complete len:151 (-),score=7.97 TRINITY_DN40047_c0_g1_i1:80-532(-)